MPLASRIRARIKNLFPPAPPPPKPGPKPPGSSFDSWPSRRPRIVADPTHPDFSSDIDPLWPIPEEALKANAKYVSSGERKIHPHTLFGRTGFGLVEFPKSMTSVIRVLVDGVSF